jgi:hypothetical protein
MSEPQQAREQKVSLAPLKHGYGRLFIATAACLPCSCKISIGTGRILQISSVQSCYYSLLCTAVHTEGCLLQAKPGTMKIDTYLLLVIAYVYTVEHSCRQP